MIDAYKGTNRTAVILGCAECVYRDYDLVKANYKASELVHFGVNDISAQFSKSPIEHIVSLHNEMILPLKTINKLRYNIDSIGHSLKSGAGVDCSWFGKISNIGGTSSLFAVEIAILLGFNNIVVCGVPLDNTPHYYEDLREFESEVYHFGKVPEANCWIDKIRIYKENGKNINIKAASGVLKTYFGGINGE